MGLFRNSETRARTVTMRDPKTDQIGALEDIRRHLDTPPDDFGVVADLMRRPGRFPGETFLDTATLITYTWSGSNWYVSSYFNREGASRRNYIDNGDLMVQQRGAGPFIGTGLNYCADRWLIQRAFGAVGMTVTVGASPMTGQFGALRVLRDLGNATNFNMNLVQVFPYEKALSLQGKTVTFSWYHTQIAASNPDVVVAVATGTGANGSALRGTMTAAANTVFQIVNHAVGFFIRHSITFVVPTTCTELEVQYIIQPIGVAAANDFIDFYGFQLEEGTFATPVIHESYQAQLAECQRYAYYPFSGLPAVNSRAVHGWGNAPTTASADILQQFPVRMRAIPTFDAAGSAVNAWLVNDGLTSFPTTVVPTIQAGFETLDNMSMVATVAAASLTVGTSYRLMRNLNQINPGFTADL